MRKILPALVFNLLASWQMTYATTDLNWDDFNATVGIKIQKLAGPTVCSGVLIHPQVVLTAAHCLVDLQSASVTISHKMDQKAAWVNVLRGKMHPEYEGNLPGISVDVGLLFLQHEITGVNFAQQGVFEMSQTCERIGYGGRDGQNTRTWITSFPQEIQGSYVRVQDSYGVLGDSGGPVYQKTVEGLRLIGVHTGRAYGAIGNLKDVSFVQLLHPEAWGWVLSQLP